MVNISHVSLEYVMLPKNTTCSVKGMSSIIDKHGCQNAIEAIKIASSIKSEMDADYPKGCYQHKNGKIYFNTHSTGSRNRAAAPLCLILG